MEGASRWRAAGVGICLLTSCVESHGIDSGADAAGSFDARSDEGAARPPSHVRWARAFPVLEPGAWGGGSGVTTDGVDLGGGPLPDGGGVTMLVAKLSGVDGAHVWSRSLFSPGPGEVIPQAVATTPDDDVVVTGWTWDAPVDLGGGELPSGRPAAFTVRLSGLDGAHVWSRPLGGSSVAVAPDGAWLVVAGGFTGALDCGGGVTLHGPSDGSGDDAFVVLLDASDGRLRWCASFAGDGYQEVGSAAVDASGEITVTGDFQRVMSVGPFTLDSGPEGVAMFVAHLGARRSAFTAHPARQQRQPCAARMGWRGSADRLSEVLRGGLDGIVWRRLDRTGAPLAEPVLLGRYPMM